MRTRRVGSVTCGISLVFFGILFLLSPFVKILRYSFILHFWPFILIGLGLEMLAANHQLRNDTSCSLKYDKGAIFIMIILMLFAACMGSAEFYLDYIEAHPYW
ncbi:MAG: DUF5668 domain-containing protein [Lachnospiraceae bacterium]|nr:DUF5668 domain-containing protein [Lachnospiraceae bacterium]